MALSDAAIMKASADWIKFLNCADHSTSRGISHKRHKKRASFLCLLWLISPCYSFALKPPQIGSFEKHAMACSQVAVPEQIRHTRLHRRLFEEGAVPGIEDRAGNEFIHGQQIGQQFTL